MIRSASTAARSRRPEQDFQIALVRDLRAILAPGVVFFHVPNGGGRSAAEAAIFKAMGVLAGVPDLVFLHAGRAVFLELKADKRPLSTVQIALHQRLIAAGMAVGIARDLGEALAFLAEHRIPTRIKEA